MEKVYIGAAIEKRIDELARLVEVKREIVVLVAEAVRVESGKRARIFDSDWKRRTDAVLSELNALGLPVPTGPVSSWEVL